MRTPAHRLAALLLALGALALAAAPAAAAAKKKKPTPAEAKKAADEAEAAKEMDAGGALFAAGSYADALPHFEHARDLSPGASGPYRALGYTYKHLDRLEDAKDAFDRYVKTKGSGPTVDEALAEMRAIDEELRKRELALKTPPPSAGDDKGAGVAPPPDSGGATPGAGAAKSGGFGPLRIAGIGGMALGAGAAAVGVFFVTRWLSARSSFSDEYDSVRAGLTVEPGASETLYICKDDDFAMFTAESQAMLAPARLYCGPLARYRVLGPALAAGGVVLIGAGLALFLAGGSGGGHAPADSYALDLPGLGKVRLDAAPLRNGLLVSGTVSF